SRRYRVLSLSSNLPGPGNQFLGSQIELSSECLKLAAIIFERCSPPCYELQRFFGCYAAWRIHAQNEVCRIDGAFQECCVDMQIGEAEIPGCRLHMLNAEPGLLRFQASTHRNADDLMS